MWLFVGGSGEEGRGKEGEEMLCVWGGGLVMSRGSEAARQQAFVSGLHNDAVRVWEVPEEVSMLFHAVPRHAVLRCLLSVAYGVSFAGNWVRITLLGGAAPSGYRQLQCDSGGMR